MQLSHDQRRALRGEINLYPVETALGWRVIRMVSVAVAMEKLAMGEWREVRDEHGHFMGCQMLATFRTDQELPSGASSTSITARECMLNAGVMETRRGVLLGVKSRTVFMSEDERVSRRRKKDGKALPPEDAIERAIAKVREFAGNRVLAPIVVKTVGEMPELWWDAHPEFAGGVNEVQISA